MRIIAVDPGNMTGVAMADLPDGKPESWEIGDAMTAVNFVKHKQADLIVVEDFRPRPGIRTWQPDALHIIGALRFVAWETNTELVLQQPSDAKRFSTNDKLDRIKWYHPTEGGHANDAMRHLMLAGVKRGVLAPPVDPEWSDWQDDGGEG